MPGKHWTCEDYKQMPSDMKILIGAISDQDFKDGNDFGLSDKIFPLDPNDPKDSKHEWHDWYYNKSIRGWKVENFKALADNKLPQYGNNPHSLAVLFTALADGGYELTANGYKPRATEEGKCARETMSQIRPNFFKTNEEFCAMIAKVFPEKISVAKVIPDRNYQPCSYYEGMPENIRKFIRSSNDFGLNLPKTVQEWKEQNFVDLAKDKHGAGHALLFVELAETAYELTDDKKHYTENAICAQKVMTQIRPTCCSTNDDFYKMIAKTCKRSEIQRVIDAHPEIYKDAPTKSKSKKTGAVMETYKGFDVAGDLQPFEQQEMLAMLDAKLHPAVTGEPKLSVSDEHIKAGLAMLKQSSKEQQARSA